MMRLCAKVGSSLDSDLTPPNLQPFQTLTNFKKTFFTLTYNPYDYKVSNEGCQGQKAIGYRQGYDSPHTMFTIVYFSRVFTH